MRRILSVMLVFCLVFPFALTAGAAMPTLEGSLALSSNDYYCVSEIQVIEETVSRSTAKTITAKKSTTYYSPENVAIAVVTVIGSFTYDGTAAKATASDVTYQVLDTAWRWYDDYSYCSGATAIAVAFFKLDIATERVEVRLTCSPTGTLS